MSRLTGKTAVVTGASRGIGAAIAARLHAQGAVVARLARTLRASWHERLLDLPCDLTQEDDVQRAAERILGQFGPPDIIVNNAGAFLLAPLELTRPADFDAQVAVNLRAPFLVARAFLPPMRTAGRGLLITIGSAADHVGFPENSAYAASKFGLRGLHEVLSEELRGSGVRCTLVSPGSVDTTVWDLVDPDHRPGFTPRKAMLKPDDVAAAVAYVASAPAHVHIDWIRLGPV